MSKLRKVCAVLCSGMCALGSVNADLKKNGSLGKSDFIKSQKEEYLNKRIQENMEARSKAGCYAPYSPVSFGLSFGEYAKSARAGGALEMLKDPKILEYFDEGDLESIEKISKNRKAAGTAVYILLRWVLSLAVGAGAFFGTAQFIMVPILNKIDKWRRDAGKNQLFFNKPLGGVVIFVVSIIVAHIANSSTAGGFNVLAEKLLGESEEVQKMGEELLAIMKRAEKKFKDRKVSKSAPVKKGKNNLNSASDKNTNQKLGVENTTFDKSKLSKQKVASMSVVGKNSNKAGKLNRSVGVVPVSQ